MGALALGVICTNAEQIGFIITMAESHNDGLTPMWSPLSIREVRVTVGEEPVIPGGVQ